MDEIDKYMEMIPSEINSFKPLLESNNWVVDTTEWFIIKPTIFHTLNIPEKPGQNPDLEASESTQCLNSTLVNTISIVPSRTEEVFAFNNIPYALNKYIGVKNGVYVISNVSENHPIGFVINDLSKFEIIEGNEFGVKIVEGLFVMHYYGKVRFEVKGDFGIISYHCYNHGYMGGEKRFKYDTTC